MATTRGGTCSRASSGSGSGDEEVVATAGSAVVARRGTPHTYWNAGDVEARYLLIMTPRIASLIGAIHAPGADIPAVFAEHDSEILPTG